MATKVTMPKLGLTMVEGKITEWKKKEGDRIEKGEILFVIETEKVQFEVEATASGTLAHIIAHEGDVLPVGAELAYILATGEQESDLPHVAGGAKAAIAAPPVEAKVPSPEPIAVAATPAVSPDGKVKISPVARKIAEEHGIDVNMIKGTGPEGRIVREDVLRVVEEKQKPQPATKAPDVMTLEVTAEDKLLPLTGMRSTIARRMSQSMQTAPHFWVVAEADGTRLTELRTHLLEKIEKETGVRLTYTDLLVKIAAKALQIHPDVNSTWTEKGVLLLGEINIGIATDVPDGLLVPVIHNAAKKTIAQIAVERASLVQKAREGKLGLDDMTSGTFTLNNVGALGIKCIDAIINSPESAILTIGSAIKRPVVVNDEIVIRPIMELSLGSDHRSLDGAKAGRFLKTIKDLIEEPLIALV